MASKFLTVDIGNDSIKIAEVSSKNEKVQVYNAIKVDNPNSESIEDGFIRNKEMLVHTIRTAINDAKIKSKKIVFSVTSSKIITREIVMPYVQPKKLGTIIKMNSREYFPVNINDYVIDHNIISTSEDKEQNQQRVLIIAAPNNLVAGYYELAEALSLKLQSIDFSGNSIIQLLKTQFYRGTNLFIELGSQSTLVTILTNGKFELQRHLPYGTAEVYSAVMNHFDVSYQEAVEMMKNKSFFSLDVDSNPYLTGDITSAVNQIMGGVSRLLDYFSSRNKDSAINQIYLLGDGVKIYGLERYIGKFFNMSVEVVDRFYSVNGSKVPGFSQDQIYYSVCLGAALSTLNIMPESILNSGKGKKRTRIFVELVLLASVLSAFTLMIPKNQIDKLEKEKKSINQKIEAAKYIEEVMDEHNIVKNQLDNINELNSKAKNNSEYLLDVLNTMDEISPTHLYYLALRHTDESLELNGIANNKLAVAKYIQQIKTMDRFASIFVSDLSHEYEEISVRDIEGEDLVIDFNAILKYSEEEGDE
ncbi:MAG: pilus assembly protein PilM [Halanaerobiales bacterium]